jgi:hypothetical protein
MKLWSKKSGASLDRQSSGASADANVSKGPNKS